MERYGPFEPEREEGVFWVPVDGQQAAPNGWEAIVTFPLSDGSRATAVFLSEYTAGVFVGSVKKNNPHREVGATPHGSNWLIEALEARTDIDCVVSNAASVITRHAKEVGATSRENFINMLKREAFTDFRRQN